MPKNKKSENDRDVEVRGVDLHEVERLLKFMEQHGLEEFEYEGKGFRVRLKKVSAYGDAMRAVPHVSHAAAPVPHAGAPAAGSPAPVAPAAVPEDVHIVKSPIVGTFYVAPSPDAEPFVKIGSHVDKGQTLGIIEAMKLMNEIESDVAGEVVQVFVSNGNPVEYGESLFGIRTKKK